MAPMRPIMFTIFRPADDSLLNYLKEGNNQIEPEWYMPVILLSLINGAEGIGTGLAPRARFLALR